MAKRPPWRSDKQSIHHNNAECKIGDDNEKENLQPGAGGQPLCEQCTRLA